MKPPYPILHDKSGMDVVPIKIVKNSTKTQRNFIIFGENLGKLQKFEICGITVNEKCI